VARNAAINEQRGHLRRARLTSDLARRARHSVRDIADEVVNRHDYEAVFADVTALPQRQRDPLALHVRDDLTVAQIAVLLDLSPRTVRYLLGQARTSIDSAEERRNRLSQRVTSLAGFDALRRLRTVTLSAGVTMSALVLVTLPTIVPYVGASTRRWVPPEAALPRRAADLVGARGSGVAMPATATPLPHATDATLAVSQRRLGRVSRPARARPPWDAWARQIRTPAGAARPRVRVRAWRGWPGRPLRLFRPARSRRQFILADHGVYRLCPGRPERLAAAVPDSNAEQQVTV
jgi:hypothetical protein